MLAHIVSLAVLALFAVETYRTVQNFKKNRGGLFGSMLGQPKAHRLMAAILTAACGFAIYAGIGPVWAAPAYMVVSLYYLVHAFRFRGIKHESLKDRRSRNK